MKQLCGVFDLQTGQYEDMSNGICKYTDDVCEVYVCGNVQADRTDITGKLLWDTYKKWGNRLTEHISGLYILVLYDKNSHTLHIFHDRTTSPLTLYYTSNGTHVYLSTTLKWLLRKSDVERRFNDAVLEEFLVNGFIYGKETLIEKVYKLSAFKGLMIQTGEVQEFPVQYAQHHVQKGEALGRWETVLEESICKSFADKEEISIPLSSGYDSNYIAYIVSRNAKRPINAFSVGGKFGKNEVPVVEENAAEYSDVHLSTALTDEDSLSNFPDIVWRLEGAVYEVGIFLQYELAKLVHKNGKNLLICGECADQVMNQNYLRDDRIHITQKSEEPIYFEFSEYPYIFGSFLILKKNGLLSNSFGIDTEYPYLDDEFVSIAHSLREINKKDKRIHVAICQENLPDSVLKNIAKTGGATDFHSLFATNEEVERFIANIEGTEFFKRHSAEIKKHSYIEQEKQTGIKLIKTKIRNFVLDTLHINAAERKQTAYFLDEIRIKEYMCCAYLMLFDKLFISGEYDDQLDCEGINISLRDMMK